MKTTHQYLDKYPISPDSRRLIVGTIHPHDHQNFAIPFFYGNVLSLWNIFQKAFPEHFSSSVSLTSILEFLRKEKISVSDTIRLCERKNPTALDKDLIPIELNRQIVDQIKESHIEEIFFTSGFAKNNAFRLFYTGILGLKITKEIRANRGLTLDHRWFGRPVRLTVLYSPSGTSNVGLSKSKIYLENKERYRHSSTPVSDFKVAYYRDSFTR